MAMEEVSSRRGASPAHGACNVVTRDLRTPQLVCRPLPSSSSSLSSSSLMPRRMNAYYPDFAYRIDVKRKSLQVLSVVGPSKWVAGVQVESASCFNRLRAEGEARCMEEYGKQLGFNLESNTTSTFFTAIFECLYGEEVKWVNELPFDAGASELVMSLARHAQSWIQYFQRNISKLPCFPGARPNPSHTRLSLVLQLDVINCESWVNGMPKQPYDVRFEMDYTVRAVQGAAKKQKGVRYRHDRAKWVAEYNPPGKKNNKISLGEYDNEAEAGRAADAGMFCYCNSKRASYNFHDSPSLLPSYLQQAPRPVSDDKEAVRKWARDFAKLTTSGSFNSTSSCSSWNLDAPASPSSSRLTFLDMSSSSRLTFPDMSSSSRLTFPDMSSPFDIPSPSIDFSRPTSNIELLEFESDSSLGCFSDDLAPMPTQINSSPPLPAAADTTSCFLDDFLPLPELWNASSPPSSTTTLLSRTVSDGRGDDFMNQYLMSWGSPAPEVDRCQYHLIR